MGVIFRQVELGISFPFQASLICSLPASAGGAQMIIVPTNTAARLGETIRLACLVTPGDSIVVTYVSPCLFGETRLMLFVPVSSFIPHWKPSRLYLICFHEEYLFTKYWLER